ncbi:uncharacterized protein A4U43_C02F16590 [Asparagus officinalis]|uniref:Uncharacterized protein n=1 Tax=Asparagus officinalis TaxID=4686 RepID=A0A5P1FLI7_ASPOF|nr:uncharacterized protein A4U43_C02F16590 [Asparagus officinalis]
MASELGELGLAELKWKELAVVVRLVEGKKEMAVVKAEGVGSELVGGSCSSEVGVMVMVWSTSSTILTWFDDRVQNRNWKPNISHSLSSIRKLPQLKTLSLIEVAEIMSTNSSSKRCTRMSSRVSPADVVPRTTTQSWHPPRPSALPPAVIPASGDGSSGALIDLEASDDRSS